MGLAFSRIWERMFGKKEMVTFCVQINQCVGCTATPSSRRRVDGVEGDAAIQYERAVTSDFHTGAITSRSSCRL